MILNIVDEKNIKKKGWKNGKNIENKKIIMDEKKE